MISESTTPLMRQYYQIKSQFPDTLLLFQVGDFYELFFDDAKQAATFLSITLTKRGKNNGEPIPLCGVPVHAIDHYLTKLVRGGFKVALCDQLEEARPGKMVERGVTRVFTPGTLTESTMLDAKNASYLFSFFPLADSWGLLFGELLTAQLYATLVPAHHERILESELARFFPDEILLPSNSRGKSFQSYFKNLGYFTSLTKFHEDDEQQKNSVDAWLQQFNEQSKIILRDQEAVRLACLSLYAYLRATHETALNEFNQIQLYQPDEFLLIDAATQKNLELVKNSHDGGRSGTLLAVMDKAATGMGSRMIKKWLLHPLVNPEAIMQRQEVVGLLKNDALLLHQVRNFIGTIGDSERVIGRIALKRAQLNDYLMLMTMVATIPQLQMALQSKKDIPLIHYILANIPSFGTLHELLIKSLNDDSTKDWIIKQGFDEQLDRMRSLIEAGNEKIVALEQCEQQATGIGSLKIRYNSVHGYSIEITKTHYDAIPAHYIRRQTLVGRERFTTPELQQLEYDIAQAKVEIVDVEKALFETVKGTVANHIADLRNATFVLAQLDALVSFATIAYDHNYVQPDIAHNHDICIEKGRHPVVERSLSTAFIPNDTHLNDEQSIWIITGPNMGGKSTYLRQVALISIMAHCGSFVPAKKAIIPILDRVFTRIGAGDNLVAGKSTFMVEMEETAAICSQATNNSLIILDEVGRGTSTFDGLAIAQAVVEHIYQCLGARSLFATHYHELTGLEHQFPGIVSYYAASSKTPRGIVFLYKIVRGTADGSFGLEVAKLAALPPAIIERAETILEQLTQGQGQIVSKNGITSPDDELLNRVSYLEKQLRSQKKPFGMLRDINYDELSPKQAFDLLWKLKEHSEL